MDVFLYSLRNVFVLSVFMAFFFGRPYKPPSMSVRSDIYSLFFL